MLIPEKSSREFIWVNLALDTTHSNVQPVNPLIYQVSTEIAICERQVRIQDSL